MAPQAVTVSLKDLENGSIPLSTLEDAFGPASLGIILVKDLPSEYPQLRRTLLSYSSYLANLPEEELAKVERADAKYTIGWSCGKETLGNGRYDTLKGSYYAQPIHNPELEAKARSLYPTMVEMTSSNVWPDQSVLPGMEKAFEDLCHLIVDVASLVARNCDRYGVAKLEGYQDGTLESIVRTSVSTKARLLHYFPPASIKDTAVDSVGTEMKKEEKADDDWCATHTDLGALTGLTSQMFIDEHLHPPTFQVPQSTYPPESYPASSDLPELSSHPDPKTGLWIKDRSGTVTQVDIPRDCLAFQTGMALQLITRGKFRAVPHFVRGASGEKAGNIARNTLAVFTQPNLWDIVDEEEGLDFAGLAKKTFEATV